MLSKSNLEKKKSKLGNMFRAEIYDTSDVFLFQDLYWIYFQVYDISTSHKKSGKHLEHLSFWFCSQCVCSRQMRSDASEAIFPGRQK